MVAGMFYRQWCRARADSRDAELYVRVGKEMLFNNNGKVDVNGKTENFAERCVLRGGRGTF